MKADNTIKNGIIIGVVVAIVVYLVSLGYTHVAYQITTRAEYYTNLDTNETVIKIFLYNSGIRTINNLDADIENDCHIAIYSPKISDSSQNCNLTNSRPNRFECTKLSVKDDLSIIYKSTSIPSENCTIKIYIYIVVC